MQIMTRDRSFYKTLAALAIPLTLQSLITYGVGFVDNVMVGSLGDLAISGVFLASQVQNILQMLTAGLGAALVVLAAQYFGKGDDKNAKAIISIALKITLGIGLACTVLVLLFPRFILGLFTTDAAVIQEGMRYIVIVCFSYVFFCAHNVLLSAMRCVENTKIGLLSSVVGLVVNIALNWVLIFGKLGFPALGVVGAAIATLIARAIEFFTTLVYVRFVDTRLLLRTKDVLHTDWTLTKDFAKYGLPIVAGDVLWGVGGAVQVAILGRIGTEVVAANTIAGSLNMVIGVVVYSVASATGIIIGRTVGSGNFNKVKEYAKTLQVIFLVLGVLTGLAFFFLKDLILDVAFTGISAQARQYASQFLTVLSITIVGTAYQMSVLTGIVRAGGATSFVLINDLFWVWLVVIPSSLLSAFVFHAPPWVTFACLKSDQILKCIVAVIKLNRWDWMKKITRDASPQQGDT